MDDATAVLVVDDEEGMREGMRRVLERRGFSVDTAADGGSALALL
ncbi:MAG: response regulator, partial [Spirochaetia bacterium]